MTRPERDVLEGVIRHAYGLLGSFPALDRGAWRVVEAEEQWWASEELQTEGEGRTLKASLRRSPASFRVLESVPFAQQSSGWPLEDRNGAGCSPACSLRRYSCWNQSHSRALRQPFRAWRYELYWTHSDGSVHPVRAAVVGIRRRSLENFSPWESVDQWAWARSATGESWMSAVLGR